MSSSSLLGTRFTGTSPKTSSSLNTREYVSGPFATPLPESDLHDEQLRALLASPLCLQEREASAERSQVYHSERENLMSSSSQDPFKPKKFELRNVFSQRGFSRRTSTGFWETLNFSSDSLTRQMLRNLFLMGTEITCLLKRDLNS